MDDVVTGLEGRGVVGGVVARVRATLHPVLPGRIGYNTYRRINSTRLSLPKLQGPRSAHRQL